MVTRDQAQQKWINNFQSRIGIMADRMGDTEEFVAGVANYLGVSEAEIRNSDSGSQVVEDFENNSDLTQSQIEDLIVENVTGANTLDEAMSELADKWDNNYEEAFTG